MRYLKRYENHRDIEMICSKYGIQNYTINDDETIDVEDSWINLDNQNLDKLYIYFRNVQSIDISKNRLRNLKDCPIYVDRHFDCSRNNLTTLDGSPKKIGVNFNCSHNILTSLKGAPKHIGGDFWCIYNQINTFEGLDFIDIGADFHCEGNPIWYIWRLFEDYTKFEFFNDCDPIRENRVIILDRLNFFLDYIGKKTVTEVSGYKCI
jgi:hypothetical protein